MPRSVMEEQSTAKSASGISAERLTEIYRLMYLSRRLDDREIILKHQQICGRERFFVFR